MGYWIKIDAELIDAGVLSAYELALYVVIVRHINQHTGVGFPSKARLASLTGMSRSSVSKYLGRLEAKGVIAVERRTQDGESMTNHYRLRDADGVGRHTDGVGRVADGVGRVADGVGRVADGVGRVAAPEIEELNSTVEQRDLNSPSKAESSQSPDSLTAAATTRASAREAAAAAAGSIAGVGGMDGGQKPGAPHLAAVGSFEANLNLERKAGPAIVAAIEQAVLRHGQDRVIEKIERAARQGGRSWAYVEAMLADRPAPKAEERVSPLLGAYSEWIEH